MRRTSLNFGPVYADIIQKRLRTFGIVPRWHKHLDPSLNKQRFIASVHHCCLLQPIVTYHMQTNAHIVLGAMAVSCRDVPSVTSDTDSNKLVCLFKDDGEREWLLTDMGACGLNLCWPCLANSAWLAVLGCIGIINQGCLMPANDWLFQHTCFAVWLRSFFPNFHPI